MTMILTPSYGRDYKSKAAVLEAWKSGKDFTIRGLVADAGRQINIEDANAHGIVEINVRYNQDKLFGVGRLVAVLYRAKTGEWKAR